MAKRRNSNIELDKLLLMAGALCMTTLVTACNSGSSPVPPAPSKPVLAKYTNDADLVKLDASLISPTAIEDVLIPGEGHESDYALSKFETKAAYASRLQKIAGNGTLFVMAVPAAITYDAASQTASFCVRGIQNDCLLNKSAKIIDVESTGIAAPNLPAMTTLSRILVSSNHLQNNPLPIVASLAPQAAQALDQKKSARIAFVFSFPEPFEGRPLAVRSGTLYDFQSMTNMTLHKLVVYEEGGAVLASVQVPINGRTRTPSR